MEIYSSTTELIVAGVQIIVMFVVALYTWETHKLRKGQDTLIKQNIESVEPNIIVSFEEGNSFWQIYIEIENIGKQPAYDVKFSITPPFDVKNYVYNKYVNENEALSKGLPLFKGGSKFRILAAATTNAKKYYTKGEINADYIFTINYRDSNSKQYTKTCNDSLHKFFVRLHPRTKSLEAIALENISRTLGEISRKLPESLDNNEDML